ncbi:MAG: restriction endonuclease subunit S [Crocinitomicaceae bacterium]|nr:restriction endonuclease subunit S [Crocinitomicaceae bacterium]
MPNNWKKYKLGELVQHKKGFAFKSAWFESGGVPVVRISDTTENSINLSTCHRINNNLANDLRDYMLKFDEVVIATVGSWPPNYSSVVGKVIRVPKEAEGALLNQNAVKLISNHNLDNRFLYYSLKAERFLKYITTAAQGSANQASIKLTDIFDFIVDLPPLKEQQAIAEILSALDDKIELNLQTNKTLEEMANAYLQNTLKNNEPKKILLGDLISLQNGYAFKGDRFVTNGNHAVLKIKNINNGFVDIYSTDFIAEEEAFKLDAKFRVKSKDVLIAMTGAEIGKIGMVEQTTKTLWLNQRVGLLVPKFDYADKLAYLFVNSKEFQNFILNKSTGSAQPNISGSEIESIEIYGTKIEALKKSTEFISPLFDQMANNLKENNLLKQTRDYLLPKLISGEIRVKKDPLRPADTSPRGGSISTKELI